MWCAPFRSWSARASTSTCNGRPASADCCCTDAEYGDDPLPDADLALLPGSRASFAPRWQGSASASYEWPLGNLIGRFTVGAKHTTEYNTGSDLDPQKLQDAYTLVNARFGIGSANRSWTLELWGQNLTDETYSQVGFDAPLQTGSWNAFLGAPRLYGLTLRLAY